MGVLICGALLSAAFVGFIFSQFDGGEIRRTIAQQLSQASGRQWTIASDAKLKFGLKPVISVAQLAAKNAAWASDDSIVKIEQLSLESDWRSLISGAPAIKVIDVSGVVINLETDGEQGRNWLRPEQANSGDGEAAVGTIDEHLKLLEIEDVEINFRSGWALVHKHYTIDRIALETASASEPLQLSVHAHIDEQPVTLTGQLGSLAAIRQGRALGVDIAGLYQGRESNADVALSGEIGRIAGLKDMRVKFTMKANSLNDVGSISGFELPRDTPVAITAYLVNSGNGPQLEDYVLRIGQAILRPQDGS